MEQLILRQAAIDALADYIHNVDKVMGTGKLSSYDCKDAAQSVLDELPSVQPYTIHSDGRLWVTVDDIDKVNAVVVDESKSKFCKQFYMDAEPEPKKGKWIHISEEMWKCDQCGEISCCSPNFCPDCGSYNGDENEIKNKRTENAELRSEDGDGNRWMTN